MEIPSSERDRTTEILVKNRVKMPIQTPNLGNRAFCNFSEPPYYSRRGLDLFLGLGFDACNGSELFR